MKTVEELAIEYINRNFPEGTDNLEAIKWAYIDGYNAARYTFIPVNHKNNCIYIDNDDLNLSINV